MKKKIIQPKYVDLAWLKGQGFAFPKLIEYHGMKKLVEMKGTYYSDLVRVFDVNVLNPLMMDLILG